MSRSAEARTRIDERGFGFFGSAAMRALVVNGDDFGLTPGINAGVLHAHTHGILTSASLFANAPATNDAIAIARRTSALSVGCHLTLVDGFPLSAASELPTLAPGGRFRRTWSEFIRDAVFGRIRLHEIEREVTAQVQRLAEAGMRVTHLDSHKHVHAYPPVFALVARVARLFGIRTVRVLLRDTGLCHLTTLRPAQRGTETGLSESRSWALGCPGPQIAGITWIASTATVLRPSADRRVHACGTPRIAQIGSGRDERAG